MNKGGERSEEPEGRGMSGRRGRRGRRGRGRKEEGEVKEGGGEGEEARGRGKRGRQGLTEFQAIHCNETIFTSGNYF
jgi:hypothetical protein